ncbi:YegP family protein [Halopiger goleimassiliensis]|uniref:YegP family protein n=1 Tax=Halopiger goleimassiliensis TaxID=1293048 RepID=UPI000677A1D7|nr:YegP family protein [Halopiger goleimassiliensis]
MAVSSPGRSDPSAVDWLQRATTNRHGSSVPRDGGPAALVGLALPVAGLASSGSIAAVQWTDRGLELSTGVAVGLGLVALGCVLALVRFLDRQHETAVSDDPDAVAIPTTKTDADGHVAVRYDANDGEEALRVHRVETVAEGDPEAIPPAASGDDLETLRETIEGATLREMRDPALYVYEDDETWRWSLVRSDGTTLATATRGYECRAEARDAVAVLNERGPDAEVLDPGTAAFAVTRRDGRWYWQLLDGDRTALAESADGYRDPDGADAAIDPFVETIADARVIALDGVGFELYADGDAWSWRLVEGTSHVLADATERFESRRTAENAAAAVRSGLESAAVTVAGEPTYERYREDDRWCWRLVDGSGRTVARSAGEASTHEELTRAVDLFAAHAPDADHLEFDDAAYEVVPTTDPATFEGPGSSDGGTEVRTDGASPPSAQLNGDSAVPAGVSTSTASSEAGEAVSKPADESIDGSSEDGSADGQARESNPAPADAATVDADGWYWRLVTAEREVLAVGPEPTPDPEAATDAIERVREGAREADLIEFDDAAFRVYETDAGEWRWRLIDENGGVLADSGTEHDSRTEAAEAMMTLKEQAPDADVLEIETAAFELFAAGDGWRWRLVDSAGNLVALDPTSHPTREGAREAMTRLLEHLDAAVHRLDRPLFQSSPSDGWRWRFVLPGGEPIAVAGDAYATNDELVDRLETVREIAADASSHDVGAYCVELTDRGDWDWCLLDRNREVVADGTRSDADRETTREAVERLQRHAPDAPIFAADAAAIRLERSGDDWQWSLVSSDGDRLGGGVEGVGTESAVRSAIERVRRLASSAARIDRTDASFDVVETDDGWRWRLLDGDGRVVATASEAWESVEDAHQAVTTVRSSLEDASVLERDGPAFELFVADDGWRWRLVDAGETTVLESTRTYETRTEATRAVDRLQSLSFVGRDGVETG